MTRFASVFLAVAVGVTILFTGCSDDDPVNNAPDACFVVRPASGTTDTVFQFDASCCSDAEDPVTSLEVRWDWENDGTWDTDWSTTKTVSVEYDTPGTKTIALQVKDKGERTDKTTRQVEVIEPGCAWTTTYEDLFESMILSPAWSLLEGDTSVYSLDGEALVVDDSDAYTGGPLLIYEDPLGADTTRIICQVRTEDMNGQVQLGFIMSGDLTEDEYYVFGLWDGLRIIEADSQGENLMAFNASFEMGDHETLIMECEVRSGILTWIIKDPSGAQLARLSAVDSTPLTPGFAGFFGEIDETEGQYLYFDWIKLEECE
jgi:hypothetical protein